MFLLQQQQTVRVNNGFIFRRVLPTQVGTLILFLTRPAIPHRISRHWQQSRPKIASLISSSFCVQRILDASLGQNTGGGVTFNVDRDDAQGANTFPDLHMSNKAFHVLTIGASIIDQADPDSVPTRIQFQPTSASVWWTAYGVESLPYLVKSTQLPA